MVSTTVGSVVGASYGPPKRKSAGAHYLRGDLEQIFPGRWPADRRERSGVMGPPGAAASFPGLLDARRRKSCTNLVAPYL